MIIWLIDDDETFNFLSEKIVMASGYFSRVKTFADSEVALNEYLKCISRPIEQPDLLILDIMMPKINGFQFLEKISEEKYRSKGKVAMLTSSLEEADRKRAFEFDCVIDFVSKPFSKAKLGNVIQKLDF